MLDGRKILIDSLPLVLTSIYKELGEDLKEKEILIIGNEEELIIKVIEALYKEVRFITLIGDNKNSIENISKYTLKKMGLSIFYSKNIDRILKNYSVIINLKDNVSLDTNKLRKKVIIFDFSITKGISGSRKNKRGPVIIEDFMFKTDDLNIRENQWIEYLIPSYIYEYFYLLKSAELIGLLVDGSLYNIKDLTDNQIRKKTVST